MVTDSVQVKRLLIGAWPSRLLTNPYNEMLYSHLAEYADVIPIEADRLSLFKVLGRRVDVLHLHWLDRILWDGRVSVTLKRMGVFLLIALIVKLRGGKLIWTAHDPEPHRMAGTEILENRLIAMFWQIFQSTLVKLLDGVIVLTSSHIGLLRSASPAFVNMRFKITPHPHYRAVYPDVMTRKQARAAIGLEQDAEVVLFLGSLRPYKGVEALIQTFTSWKNPDARLLIAGKLDGSSDYNVNIQRGLQSDERIHARLELIPDDQLQMYLRGADIFVAPFSDVTNSGSVLLALSFDCPILVPDLPLFKELQSCVGTDWVQLLEMPLDPMKLQRALREVRALPQGRTANLEQFGWDRIAFSTYEFLAEVARPRG